MTPPTPPPAVTGRNAGEVKVQAPVAPPTGQEMTIAWVDSVAT